MSIFIFSKPIHSGKTTALMQWCKQQHNCAGILMPDVDGVRKMYDIESNVFFEADSKNPLISNEALVSIGKYNFYRSAFDRANLIIVKALNEHVDWLIIDEVGKLELDKTGFYSSVKKVVESIANKEFNGNLLLVVRENLLDEVVKLFEIEKVVELNNVSFF